MIYIGDHYDCCKYYCFGTFSQTRYVTEWAELPKKGTVTSVVLSLNSEPEILIDDGDFISMSEIRDFKLVE